MNRKLTTSDSRIASRYPRRRGSPKPSTRASAQSHGRRQGVERALPGLGQEGKNLDRDHSDDGPGKQPQPLPGRPVGAKRNPKADDEAVTGRPHDLGVVSARRIAERNDDEENAGTDQHAPP